MGQSLGRLRPTASDTSKRKGPSTNNVQVSDHDKAVHTLLVQRKRLKVYQTKAVESSLEQERIAKECLKAGQKRAALLALKRKKYQESLLSSSENMLLRLEEMINTLEYTAIEKQVLDGLQEGASFLKELHREMSIDAVHAVLEDTTETQALTEELNEALSTLLTPEETAEMENELEAFVAAELSAPLQQVSTVRPTMTRHVESEEVCDSQQAEIGMEEQKHEEAVLLAT